MMKFEIYNGGPDRWYWRAVARNSRVMADGSERYAKKGNARRAVLRFIDLLGATDFEIVELD
jgi:uncharacterized protein YegP (UPF0339 family)